MTDLLHVSLSTDRFEMDLPGARQSDPFTATERKNGAEFSLNDIGKVAGDSTAKVREAARRLHFDVESLDADEPFFSHPMAERLLRQVATRQSERNATSR